MQNKQEESVSAEQALQNAEAEKQRIILAMNEKIVASDQTVAELEASIKTLKEELATSNEKLLALKSQGETQLLSLQGDYDTLDAKYQKLLRPARSSKGKYVVSVSYKKRGNKQLIRIKTRPDGSYKSVDKTELHRILAGLKKKHKNDLYLKIIIPAKSGLSYNEAWKFTNELQKKYDYYQ